MVACMSWTWTGSSVMFQAKSSVSPWTCPAFTPPPASHEAEGAAEVVAAVGLGRVALAERRAAEFAAPDDERVVEQAALL